MFLAPWFLLGLLAAAVPAVIHLRRSRRMERIIFSTNRFFDESFVRASKQAKLHDRLMMLLRMLLLMLLALALAQPLLRLPKLAGITGSGRVVAIVIDNSASMNRLTSQGTNFDQAKTAALAIIDELSPEQGDMATIVLAGWTQNDTLRTSEGSLDAEGASADTEDDIDSRVLFREPTGDVSALRQAILRLTPTDLATDLAGAVALAGKAMTPAQGSVWNKAREVQVISDLQPAAFAGQNSLDPGPGTGLYLISLAPKADDPSTNLSIDAIQYDAPQPMVGVPFTFRVLVVNHSRSSAQARINLVVDDQVVAYATANLEPARSQVVRMEYRFAEPGWRAGRVEVIAQDSAAVDVMPKDNRRFFSLNVLTGLKVLAINGSPSAVATQDELFFLRLALTAASQNASYNQQIELTQITPDQLNEPLLNEHPVIVLANVSALSQTQLELLEKRVDKGAGLLMTLGQHTAADHYNTWSSPARTHHGLLPATLGQTLIEDNTDDSTHNSRVDYIAPNHLITAGFFLQRYGDLTLARYQKTIQLTPLQNAQILLKTSDGRPLLVERPFGKGRVILYASTIDRDWNTQPLQPAFVPLTLRLVSHLSQNSLGQAGFFQTGQAIALPASVTRSSTLVVKHPDHAISYLQAATLQDNTTGWLFTQTRHAGVYRVSENENSSASLMFATNTPAGESTLAAVTREDIAVYVANDIPWVFIDSPSEMASATKLARQGTGMWQQLLIVALLITVFEPWLANRWTQWRTGGSSSKVPAQSNTMPHASTPPTVDLPADVNRQGGSA